MGGANIVLYQTLIKKIKSSILWIIILFLAVLYIYSYNKTYNIGNTINYSFDGIKYQANNIDSIKPIKIVINGTYKKEYGTKNYLFKGDIIIDNELCYASSAESNIYHFNNYNMSSIENSNFSGDFFISDLMKEMTILIRVPKQDEGSTFSFEDGWLISAPAKSRTDAIEISKKLIYPLYDDLYIK